MRILCLSRILDDWCIFQMALRVDDPSSRVVLWTWSPLRTAWPVYPLRGLRLTHGARNQATMAPCVSHLLYYFIDIYYYSATGCSVSIINEYYYYLLDQSCLMLASSSVRMAQHPINVL